ncbi:ATP-binding protein [Paraflavisolibacter sp. H34]|uniref:ATP-binding protein n=1 Tax=Huijunlia imazamoxiresistens TaxID=3127457 RepID=UPI003015B475
MKQSLFLLSLFFAAGTKAQHRVEKLWETDTTLAVPESVLPDLKKGVLYVSLIDGAAWEVDGKGGVGQLDLDGKIRNANWITGLNAPKGMGQWNNKLYVADVTQIVVIDIASGKIDNKITVEGAQALNDITVSPKGIVYISDSRAGRIYRMEKGAITPYLEDLKGVNGLKAIGKDLYLVTAKEVYKAGPDKKLTTIAPLETGGDGLEPVGKGDFIATSWPGYMYYVYANGKKDLLLDTHEQKMNTADIGYHAGKKIIYVPTFYKKSVIAYQLK